jgi:hypothetical protein
MEGPSKVLDRTALYDDDADLLQLQRQFQEGSDMPAARVTRIGSKRVLQPTSRRPTQCYSAANRFKFFGYISRMHESSLEVHETGDLHLGEPYLMTW